jgi:hypothetical protein
MNIRSLFSRTKKAKVSMADTKVHFACVFCGQPIAESVVEPASLEVRLKSGETQSWWCHTDCFKKRIAQYPPEIFAPEHF